MKRRKCFETGSTFREAGSGILKEGSEAKRYNPSNCTLRSHKITITFGTYMRIFQSSKSDMCLNKKNCLIVLNIIELFIPKEYDLITHSRSLHLQF